MTSLGCFPTVGKQEAPLKRTKKRERASRLKETGFVAD